MNLQLPGDDLNLIKPKNVVVAFVAKLLLHKKNIGRQSCNNDDLLVYSQHLENLHSGFIERFQNILKLEIPDWVLDPFSNVNIEISPQLGEELIELTTNEEIKIKYKNDNTKLNPGLWSIVERFLIAFPASYLCGFSAVTMLLAKKRNQLQVTKRGDLRLF
ncbi:hypothetical protein HUJ04_011684 [Dendroctonus ponderosae]|nr:hypothetical protein HUJ04_011684 [Dendroctonus ponderosae]